MMESVSSRDLAEEAMRLFRLSALAGRSIDSCKPARPRANSLDYHVLFMLHNYPSPHLTMSQLADAMILSKQHLSKLINSMEQKGLVKREHDPINRRQVYVSILPAGLAMVDEMIEEVRNKIAAEVEIFTEQEKCELHDCFGLFRKLLQKILDLHYTSPA